MFKGCQRLVCEVHTKTNNLLYFSLAKNNCSNSRMSSMKAYVRLLKEDERVEIKFKYVDSSIGLDRWFSSNRSMNDTAQQVKERIAVNVQKASLKHGRKKLKKIPKGEIPEELKIDVQLMQKSQILDPEVICRDFILMPDISISVNGQLYSLDIDPPAVKVLKLPTSIMAGFPVYPKIELENCCLSQCDFKWFTKEQSSSSSSDTTLIGDESWSVVGTEFSYLPSNRDIGSVLKLECTPKDGSKEGLSEAIIASQVVEAGPGLCPFEIRHGFTKEHVGDAG